MKDKVITIDDIDLFAVRILSRCINKITIDENFTYGGDRMHLRLVVKKM